MYQVLAVFQAVDNISSVAAQIGGNVETLSGRVTRLGQNMVDTGSRLTMGLTVPILAAAGAVLKLGTDFETSMTVARTMTGSSAEQFALYQAKIEELRQVLPQTMDELAQGLYFVASAGFRGQEAIDILTASGKAAANSLANVDTVAQSVVSVLNAYGLSGSDAGRVTDVLTMAVIEGTEEFEAIAGSIGRVLPIASQAGVSFEQVMASLATMTRAGLNAEEATTALRAALMNMYAPSKEAQDTLALLGLSADELRASIAEKGLLATLAMLMEVTGGNVTTLDKLFGNVRGLVGVLATAGAQSETYAEILGKVQNSLGVTDQAFATTSETARVQTALFRNSLESFAMTLSGILLPPLLDFLEKARAWVDRLKEIDPATLELGVKLAGLAAAIGPVLVVLGSLVTALGALLSPIGLVVAAVAGLVAAFATDFGGIRTTLEPLISWWAEAFRDLASDLRTNSPAEVIAEWAPRVVPMLRTTIEYVVSHIGDGVSGIVRALAEWGQAFADWAPTGSTVVRQLTDLIGDIVSWIRGKAPQLANALKTWAQEWVDFIAPYVPKVLREAQDLLGQITSWIGGKVNELGNALEKWGKEFVEWLAPRIPEMVSALGKFVAKLVSGILDALPKVVSGLAKMGTAFVEWLIPRVPDILRAVTTFFANVAMGIVAAIPGILVAIGKLALGFLKAVPDIVTFLAELGKLWKAVETWISKDAWTALQDAVKPWVDAFLSWVVELVPKTPEEMQKIEEAIGEWVTDRVAAIAEKAQEIGDALLKGIGAGIDAAKQWIMDKVNEAISWLPEWARRILGIGSPSRVFIEIGEDIMLGLADGIDQGELDVIEAMTSAINNIIGNVRDIVENLSSELPTPEVTITDILTTAFGITQETADFLSRPGIQGMIDWFTESFQEPLEAWSAALEPLVNLLGSIRDILDVTAEKASYVDDSVQGLLDVMLQIMWDVREWFDANRTTFYETLVDDWKKVVRPALEDLAEVLAPLSGVLDAVNGAATATSEQVAYTEGAVQTLLDNMLILMWDVREWFDANRTTFYETLVDDWKKVVGPALADLNTALEPLEPLLNLATSLLQATSEAASEVKLNVAEALTSVLKITQEVTVWVNDNKTALYWAIKGFQDIQIFVTEWNTTLEPLSGLLSVSVGILQSAAEAAGEVKLKVQEALTSVLKITQEVTVWVNDNKTALYWAIKGFQDIQIFVTEWNTTLEPLSGLLSVGVAILQSAAEEAAVVKLKTASMLDSILKIMQEVEAWITAHTGFGTFVKRFNETITPVLTDWNTALTPLSGLLNSAKSILDVLAGDAIDVKEKTGVFLSNLLTVSQDVQGWMNNNGSSLSSLLTAFRDRINPALRDWKDQLGPLDTLLKDAKGLYDLLNTDMGDAKSKASSFLDAIWGMISGVQGWFAAHPNYGTELMAMYNNIDPNIAALNTALKLMRGKFTDTVYYLGELQAQATEAKRLSDLFVSALAWNTSTSGTSFGSGITAAIDSANAALSDGMYTLSNTVNDAIYRLSLELPSALSDLAWEMGEAIRYALQNSISNLRVPDTSWIGQQIIGGIEAGAWGRSSDLYSSLQAIVDEAIYKIKVELGIASPSRVFMGIGRDMISGLMAGINEGSVEVASTVTSLTQGLSLSANTGAASVAGMGGLSGGSVTHEMHLHVGVLVADEAGLKELERRLLPLREQEEQRKGLG